MFLSLYTDTATGILTEQRIVKLTAAMEQEQESNQKRLHDLETMQGRADAQGSEVRTFIKEIRRYADIEELDEAVLNRLISRILIGEIKKIDGQRTQEVKMIYNFVGEDVYKRQAYGRKCVDTEPVKLANTVPAVEASFAGAEVQRAASPLWRRCV